MFRFILMNMLFLQPLLNQVYLSAILIYLYIHDIKQAEKCYNDCSQ